MAQSPHELQDGFHGGHLPAPEDRRDVRFAVAAPRKVGPIDLSARFPSVTDQGQTGSCGAHSITKARHVLVNNWRLSTGQPLLDPDTETFSELWAYYWARKEMGTWPDDSGVDNRSLCDAMLQHGGVLESDCPWTTATAPEDIKRDLGSLTPPSALCYGISGYAQIGGPGADMNASLQACLAQGNAPVFGFAVYDNFFTLDSSGLAPLPKRRNRFLGGHDIPLGIWLPNASDPGGGRYGACMSWGEGFGVQHNGRPGWCFISAAFVTQMARDRNMPADGWLIG